LKSINDIITKLGRLSHQERLLLVQAWLLLMVADLALRLFPFTTIQQYCRQQHVPRGQNSANALPAATRIVWLVEKAGQYCPVRTSCLKEALVLSRLLARRGVPTTLRIGVGRQAEAFTAHAWLEQEGRVILGDRDIDAYSRLI